MKVIPASRSSLFALTTSQSLSEKAHFLVPPLPVSESLRSPTHHTKKPHLWDSLVPELLAAILEHSDPFTQYLHSFGDYHPSNFAKSQAEGRKGRNLGYQQLCNNVWRSVLTLQWEGDLNMLPGWFLPEKQSEWYTLVTSKKLYTRLLDLQLSRQERFSAPGCFDLVNIAMRNLWLEFINPREFSPDEHVLMAATGGHVQYLQHLQIQDAYDVNDCDWALLGFNIAKEGELVHLSQLTAYKPDAISKETTSIALTAGNMEIAKQLYPLVGCTHNGTRGAASNGHFDAIRYLHEQGESESFSVWEMNLASSNGHLDVVKYLHENRREGCTTFAMDAASRDGHLEVVKWLHENRREGGTPKSMDWAAMNGHLKVVEFLSENREEGCTPAALRDATEGGHLEVVKYLIEVRGETCTKDVVGLANGDVALYLLNRFPELH
ncbi:hypothetical protein HDV05_008353 [Chytridiales sp. JEL 0842]|nr:hypothetical protein HDV05_008353 [Chytridiales sp. JEL 0842]